MFLRSTFLFICFLYNVRSTTCITIKTYEVIGCQTEARKFIYRYYVCPNFCKKLLRAWNKVSLHFEKILYQLLHVWCEIRQIYFTNTNFDFDLEFIQTLTAQLIPSCGAIQICFYALLERGNTSSLDPGLLPSEQTRKRTDHRLDCLYRNPIRRRSPKNKQL